MSTKDVETIQNGRRALNRGDVDALRQLAPDVELVPLRAVLDGSIYRATRACGAGWTT